MKWIAAIVSSVLVLGVTATAAAAPVSDTLFFDAFDASTDVGQSIASGHIITPKSQCLSGRKIDVFLSYEGFGDFGRVDRAISSGNGAFAGKGPSTDISGNPVDGVMFKLRKKKYGSAGHRRTCPAAAIAVT